MIDNCKACQTKCCHGAGGPPYTTVPFKEWYALSNTYKGYDLQCEHFTKDEKCAVYDTAKYPVECATYVCGVRTYTGGELERIKELHFKESLRREWG